MLSSAKEMAALITQHVVWVHSFTSDVVLDQGTQFTSLFWKYICHFMDATASPSSAFNPESNSQTEMVNYNLKCSFRCLSYINPSPLSLDVPL